MTSDEMDRTLYKLLLTLTIIGGTVVYAVDGDGDGVDDPADNCVTVANTDQLDTDADGFGAVCDLDDDGDDVSDEQEANEGTDPLNQYSCIGCFDFDIDIDDETSALTDGLLVLRHLFGFSGTTLVDGSVTTSAARTGASAIASYLETHAAQLDIDGDNQIEALTDGLLLLRYLFGFEGATLIDGAVGIDAARTVADEITSYIGSRVNTGSNVTTNTFSQAQIQVFTPSCASVNCHKGSSSQYGLDLSSGLAYSNLVNVPSGQAPTLNLVTRGNPNQSYLVQKIEGTAEIGDQMPLNGPALNTDLQQLLRNWIAEGAKNN